MPGDFSFLADQLADCGTHWSLGGFGALAEFTRAADEPAVMAHGPSSTSAITARGAIRLTPHADLRLFASESVTRMNWSHRVALCLPENQCAMGRRSVLTELGPDNEAMREQDRNSILFDLGLMCCSSTPASALTRTLPPNCAPLPAARCSRRQTPPWA
jgi:hypothetical protein